MTGGGRWVYTFHWDSWIEMIYQSIRANWDCTTIKGRWFQSLYWIRPDDWLLFGLICLLVFGKKSPLRVFLGLRIAIDWSFLYTHFPRQWIAVDRVLHSTFGGMLTYAGHQFLPFILMGNISHNKVDLHIGLILLFRSLTSTRIEYLYGLCFISYPLKQIMFSRLYGQGVSYWPLTNIYWWIWVVSHCCCCNYQHLILSPIFIPVLGDNNPLTILYMDGEVSGFYLSFIY